MKISQSPNSLPFFEIDGPPKAWFEFGEPAQRLAYRMFILYGDDPTELVRYANNVVIDIVKKSFGNAARIPVIFWRRRIELSEQSDDDNQWCVSFRLAVEPDLNESQWDEIEEDVDGTN